MPQFRISGVGCSLGDNVYNRVDFSSPAFTKFLSVTEGDGGMSPGRLVFTEELEQFSLMSYAQILKELTGGREPDTFNLGGPSIVSLINAAQLLDPEQTEVAYYGVAANDELGRKIFALAHRTPVNIDNYLCIPGISPFTDVFSDPDFDLGRGERTFVNNIGCAWSYSPDQLPDSFFSADLIVFGGTALVPQIHDALPQLLKRCKANGKITIVNTVFDFRNEKKNPGQAWLLGSEESFQYIDLLIMDHEEALKVSGQHTLIDAIRYYFEKGVGAFVITHGAKSTTLYSSGATFKKTDVIELPASQLAINELRENPHLKGDTTGCGDNFAGGMIASIAQQKMANAFARPDLIDAVALGTASGAYCCYYVGGTFVEQQPGEKQAYINRFYHDYLHHLPK